MLFSLHVLKTMLEFKAQLIAAKSVEEERLRSYCSAKNLKNIQPISVGVWKRLPSSLELVHSTTSAHESKEVKFTSILDFMSGVARRKKHKIELKSLILAQIERWRHALHMQVER